MLHAEPSNQRIAYLADGHLFLKVGSAEPFEILCTNAENLRERTAKLHQQNDWKHVGGNGISDAIALGSSGYEEPHLGTAIAAIAPAENEGELLYGLNSDDVAGIFLRPLHQNADEKRLIHTNESNIHTLSAPDEEGRVACSISRLDGQQNLSIYRIGSPGLTEITEGDSLDTAAAWIPGEPGQLVYQSAGIGRNANGQWIDTGHATIERLDTARGEISRLLGDRQHDFLSPQVGSKGKLHCIRRPHRGRGILGLQTPARGWLGAPARLISAISSWLSTSGQSKQHGSDRPPNAAPPEFGQGVMPGQLIDVRKLREDAALRGDTDSDIVPRAWQLIETSLTSPCAATAKVLAKGVVAFHVTPDGEILYSNGSAIFRLTPGGAKPELVEEAHSVQQILSV